MSEKEIQEFYGVSIWEMSPAELVEHNLVETWARLVDEQAELESVEE